MERRSFLQGLIGTIAAGKVILEASDAEVAAFGVQTGDSAVVQRGHIQGITPPRPGQTWPTEEALPGGKYLLYNHRGDAVAAVKSIIPRYANVDPDRLLRSGYNPLFDVEIVAVGLGEKTMRWVEECYRIDEANEQFYRS